MTPPSGSAPEMARTLSPQQVVAALDGWVGREVAVRIVLEPDQLLAVFCARLGGRSTEKGSSSEFWPLLGAQRTQHPERPGLYLPRERFEQARMHTGEGVVEVRHDGVTLNLRLL